MEHNEKYLYATAEIDGEVKEFYRKGKKPEIFFPEHYNTLETKCLKNLISNNMHLIRRSFEIVGYFYSDKFSFCKLYLPEVICEILKMEFNTSISAYGRENDFIVYDEEKLEYAHIRDKFNKHFSGNL